ncbi:MAG: hypothetical protein LBT71_05315 [Azoarcus sp.]|jgi:hypothetical protein|nr:hypothetical protein [Azoarcus sp.]
MDCHLIIDGHDLGVWRHGRDGVECALTLNATDPEAHARLRDWFASTRSRCTPVADLADERHIVERLPRVSRADRRLLIARRLAQHFPDTPLTGATLLPATPEDGLLAPVRLSALTRPALVVPWLEILGTAGERGLVDVRPLTSVPFLLESWYRRQHTLPAQGLLLAFGAGGMRQVFFRNRRLAFSRVIPARSDALTDCLPVYRDELAQALAWLSSQRLSDGPPPLRVLATADEFPAWRDIISATSNKFDFIELAPPPAAHASGILPLVLQEARHVGAGGRYDCPPLHHAQRLAQTRRVMIAVSVAAVAASVSAAAIELATAARLRDEAGQLASMQQSLQGDAGKLEAETAQRPASGGFAAWLDAGERLVRAPGIAPAAVLQATADLLNEAPWARLETLAWETAHSERGATLLPEFAAQNLPADATASTIIALEIALGDGAPTPRRAADTLASRWQRLHGAPMQTQIDADTALLQLHATLPPPPATTLPTNAP